MEKAAGRFCFVIAFSLMARRAFIPGDGTVPRRLFGDEAFGAEYERESLRVGLVIFFSFAKRPMV